MDHTKKFVITSMHRGTTRENIGDYLSAQAIRMLSHERCGTLFLPNDIGKSRTNEVVYGGGGMIRPDFSVREVFKDYSLRDSRVPYSIYGVGINADLGLHNYSNEDLRTLKRWISDAASVTVRDYKTRDFILSKLGTEVKVAPCPTYPVLANMKADCLFSTYKIGIVVSIGHTKSYQKYIPDELRMISEILTTFGSENVGIICHDEEDFRIMNKLYPDISIVKPKDFFEVKREYSKFEKIITLRAHGIIFSAACGVPCSPVLLSDKMSSLFEYHYAREPIELTFDPSKHLRFIDSCNRANMAYHE